MSTRTLRARGLVLSLALLLSAPFVVACGGPGESAPIESRREDGASREVPGAGSRRATPWATQRGASARSGAGKPGASVETPGAWSSPEASAPAREAPWASTPMPPPARAPIATTEREGDAVGVDVDVEPLGPTVESEAREDALAGGAECVCPIDPELSDERETRGVVVPDERRYRHPDGSAVTVAGGPPEGFERQPGTDEVYGRAAPGGFDRDPRGTLDER